MQMSLSGDHPVILSNAVVIGSPHRPNPAINSHGRSPEVRIVSCARIPRPAITRIAFTMRGYHRSHFAVDGEDVNFSLLMHAGLLQQVDDELTLSILRLNQTLLVVSLLKHLDSYQYRCICCGQNSRIKTHSTSNAIDSSSRSYSSSGNSYCS